jgi:pimeloyl-ACP methyl ester carboxylesterase
MRVILAHGLGRSRLSMFLLGRRLARSGCTPEYFSYSSFAENHASIVARLVTRLRGLAATDQEVGLVGHSFGGLLFREALAKVPELKVRHLVMLGTPNQPPRLAPRFYSRPPLKLLRSELGQLLTNRTWYGTLPPITVPYTIVSGTKGWRGRLSPFKAELNDAIVSVSETILDERDRPVLIPAIHTFIMNKRSVFDLIAKRLQLSM